jgi:hypothetical protein
MCFAVCVVTHFSELANRQKDLFETDSNTQHLDTCLSVAFVRSVPNTNPTSTTWLILPRSKLALSALDSPFLPQPASFRPMAKASFSRILLTSQMRTSPPFAQRFVALVGWSTTPTML